MNNNYRIKPNIMETIGIIILMLIYSIVGIFYFQLLLLLFPVGFIVFGLKNGLVPAIFSISIVSIGIGILVDITSGLTLFLMFAPMVAIVTYGIKKRRKALEILGYSSITFFLSFIVISAFVKGVSGFNFITQLEESFKLAIEMQVDMIRDSGLSNLEVLRAKNLLEGVYKYILIIMPTILLLLSLMISYANYYISVVLIGKFGVIVKMPRFSNFKLPNNIMYGIFAMFTGIFLLKFLKVDSYEAILINVVALISFMFVIQGLSVIDYLLIKAKMLIVVRFFLLMIITVFIAPLMTIITILGLIDTLFDIRKLRKQRS